MDGTEIESSDDGPVVALAYDYEQLEPEQRAPVMLAACTIKLCAAMTVVAAVTIGDRLSFAKETLRHGQFTDWLKTEFGWTDRTAQSYMRVSQMVGTEKFSDLENLGLSAAYLLARDRTPPEIRKHALGLLTKGQRVTRKMVIEMLGVPPEAKMPKEEKHTDIRPGPIDLEPMLIGMFSAARHVERVSPVEMAEAVTPLLREMYHGQLLDIAAWMIETAKQLERLGYVKAA